MNTFEILKGFQSDDVQDFVKQKETQAKPQPKVQPKAKVAPKPTQSAPQKGGKRNQVDVAASKDVREHPQKGKRFDRTKAPSRPGVRQFDRKNLPGKGSNRIKKEGSGAHNWGNPKDQAKEVEKTGKIEGEETPTTVVEGEEATAQPTETKVEEKPAEPEDNTITYEEFLKHKKSTRKESDVDVSLLRENLKKENFKVFQKEEGEEIALVQKSQKSRSRKIKKDFVELAQSTEAPKRNNNSNNRDSNNKKGYGKNKKQVPNTSDENEFPSL